jgi:hypothetical protein
MRYCPQCRIGTLDQNGLCVLCGAPAEPSTGWRRIAESSASAIAAIFSPLVLAPALVVALLALYAVIVRDGIAQRFGGLHVGRRVPLDLGIAFAQIRADPGAGLLHLLAPALLQAAIFALLLLLLLFFRRRRSMAGARAEDRRAYSS